MVPVNFMSGCVLSIRVCFELDSHVSFELYIKIRTIKFDLLPNDVLRSLTARSYPTKSKSIATKSCGMCE